jgi:LysM domain
MSTAVITPIRPALPSRSAAMRPTPVAPSRHSHAELQPQQAGKLRLTRRGRVVFTSLAAAPLVAIAAWLGVNALPAVATSSSSTVVFEYETIEPGQSLWQVAATMAPESDPRDVIADIMRLNQLETSTVSPGQRIAIPEQYAN